jgi:AraC family transcriptional regulator, regulatory protein of adaptative response / DNA-3-methyladenine glycosylase II
MHRAIVPFMKRRSQGHPTASRKPDVSQDAPQLNADSCYHAVRSRDPRFDGRFFTAVRSTGIYCRPVCPAPTPKRENVVFYVCAAAAEEAGFRPCRRCHPEAAPGTPAWLGTSATVARALRLIAAGVLDRGSVDDLASRVGVGSRHLRRLFQEELGTTPVAIAQTRRAHFARRLLDETSLPVTEIAFSAGFKSLRRFNDVTLKSFGSPPSALRRPAGRGKVAREGAIALRLPYRPPFDWDTIAAFLAEHATPEVESVTRGGYRRTFATTSTTGTIEIRPVRDANHLELLVTPSETEGLARLVDRARSLFDCSADPLQIATHLRQDPLLAPLVDAWPGIRLPGAWDGFEVAVRTILGQQVTVRGATRLAGRLAERFGRAVEGVDGLTRLFPKPEDLAEAELETIGLPSARASAVRALASAVRDGRLALDASLGLEHAVARLDELPGIGPWTAHSVAMRVLGEPDAFPSGDLALRKAISPEGSLATEAELIRRSEVWRPWRAYAAMYLWKSVANWEIV